MKEHKIAIVGIGMVGGALRKWFEKQDCELFLYDIKGIGSLEEVNKADYVYICVPTPHKEDTGCDLSYLEEAISKFRKRKTIIIKSTIIPGTTDYFQKKYPQHKILFSPEFLTAETTDRDLENPDKQIVGYTEKSKSIAKTVLKQLPKAPLERLVPAYVAEFIKYASNTYFSVKVSKNNELYDVFKKFGGTNEEFKKITEALVSDPRIGDSHFIIWHKEKRGYDGTCLPKDTKAFIKFAKDLGVDVPITEATDKYNDKLFL